MKVLILGGAGYVGTELGARLVSRGHAVSIVDPLWFGNHMDSGVDLRQQSSFDLDVADYTGYDAVVGLAALSNDPMAEYDPAQNFVLNQAAVAHAGFLARRAGVRRFVYASTCSVYGRSPGEWCTEQSAVDCSSAYAASKFFGEQALLAMADSSFSVICLRKGTISGYGRRMRLDLLLNTMVANALSTGAVHVNDPTACRPLLGLRDAVLAYELAIGAPGEVTGVYNISSQNIDILSAARTVQEMVTDAVGEPIRLHLQNVRDCRSYQVDCAKAAKVLGFHPEETLRSIVTDILSKRNHFPDIGAAHYYNVEALKMMRTHAFT